MHVVKSLSDDQKAALSREDAFGFTPFHYIIEYQLSEVCEAILRHFSHYDEKGTRLPKHIDLRDVFAAPPLCSSVISGTFEEFAATPGQVL